MIGQFDDMTRLWHRAAREVLFADREKLDRWTGLTTMIYDNFLAAKSMEFDFDVGRDLWLTKSRFPKLQRDYIDFDRLRGFLDRSEAIATNAARRGVITQMHCKDATTKSGEQQHSWGNCMLAFTYHGGKKWSQPTLGLHSRVTYIGYLGPMDMALAYVIGKKIAERTGIEVEEMAFRWYIDSLQWHGLKSVPYVISHGLQERVEDDEKYPTHQYPSVGATRRSMRGLQKRYDEDSAEHIKYGPARRMNMRFARFNDDNPVPHVPLSELNLIEEV